MFLGKTFTLSFVNPGAGLALFFCLWSEASFSYSAPQSHTTSDTARIRELASLAYDLASSKPNEALQYAHQVIDLSGRIHYTEGLAMGYSRMALAFKQLAQYDSAFHYFFQSNRLYASLDIGEGIISTLMNLGTLYERTGNYDSSAIYLFHALDLADSMSNGEMKAKVLNNLGVLLLKQNKVDEAIQYDKQALQLQLELGNQASVARASENLANAYLAKKDYVEVESNYKAALKIYTTLGDVRGLGRVNINIAAMLQSQGKPSEAFSHASQALTYYKQIANPNGTAHSLFLMADIKREMKDYDRAREYAMQSLAISKQSGNKESELQVYKILHQLFSGQGQYRDAYEYLAKASALEDSIFNKQKEEVISELKTKYETEKKDREISLMKKDRELKAQQLSRQKLLKNGFLILSILILGFGMVLFNRFQLRRKLDRARAVIDERKRISSDMHDDLGSGLSKIALLSEVMKQHLGDQSNKSELEKISATARESLEKMSEIVWSLNPKNDKLENLISYIRKFAVEYFEPTNIACKVNMPDEIPNTGMKGEQRRNVFLSVKEALHNVQKHSSASLVELSFVKKDKHGEIIIHDNGKGIDEDQLNRFGNGLQNMKQRMQSAGGYFTIEHKEGTTVRLGYQLT